MIKVTIYRDKEHRYTGFDVKGHAGFSESGKDIVCAAASALILNTINAIGKFTKDLYTVSSEGPQSEQAAISFRLKGRIGHDAKLLLDTMLLGLQTMEDNSEYKPYIDIIFEEVC